jgi:hypothetical protein
MTQLTPPDPPQAPRQPPRDPETTVEEQLAALEQKLTRWLRALEIEQFQLTGELTLVKNAAETANNGLDTLEDGLADMSYQFSSLPAWAAAAGPAEFATTSNEDPADLALPAAAPTGAGTDEATEVERPTLAALHAWVEVQIAPMVRKTTTTGEGGGIRWCRHWWEHHDAVERFTALYLTFAELSESGEPTWLSVYLRDHLDPHVSTLTSPYGPFYGCTPTKHSTSTTGLGQDPAIGTTP